MAKTLRVLEQGSNKASGQAREALKVKSMRKHYQCG